MGMEAIGKSVGSIIDERLSSPLVSGFAFSWALINWKFLVILFSDASVSQTFELAKRLHETRLEWFAFNIALPLIAALAYVYVLPFFSRPVHKKWRLNQQAVEDDRQEAAKLRRLERAESQAIISENFQLAQTVTDLKVERDGAMAGRKQAIEDKTTAELQRDSSDAEAEAYKRRHAEAKEAHDATEAKLESATKKMLKSQRALEQVAQLVTHIHQEFRLVEVGFADDVDPLHKLVLASLRARAIVNMTVQVRQLYVLSLFSDIGEPGMDAKAIETHIKKTTLDAPASAILEDLKNQGYLRYSILAPSTVRSYVPTESGFAVTSALAEYDHIFIPPGPDRKTWSKLRRVVVPNA